MTIRFSTCLVIALLGGCATTGDVVPTGNGLYKVAAHGVAGNGSAGEQKAIALRRASDYCNAKSLQMRLVDARLTDPKPDTAPAAEVEFGCDKPG